MKKLGPLFPFFFSIIFKNHKILFLPDKFYSLPPPPTTTRANMAALLRALLCSEYHHCLFIKEMNVLFIWPCEHNFFYYIWSYNQPFHTSKTSTFRLFYWIHNIFYKRYYKKYFMNIICIVVLLYCWGC